MFIKNIGFKNVDTLLETLFDFELGEAQPEIKELMQQINEALDGDETLAQELKAMEEEDRLEMYQELQYQNLANILLARYQRFVIEDNALYGINDDNRTLLYTIDLY